MRATEYFADVGIDRTIDNPYYIWRWEKEPHSSTQWYDRPTRRWIPDPSLVCYIINGEIGSEPITEEKVQAIIAGWEAETG